MNLPATITLKRPDDTPLASVIPLANTVDEVTTFDDTIDFGGTSGRTCSDLSGNKSETGCTSRRSSTGTSSWHMFSSQRTGNFEIYIMDFTVMQRPDNNANDMFPSCAWTK